MWSVSCPGLLVTHCPQAPWAYSRVFCPSTLQVHNLSGGSGQGCWGAHVPRSSPRPVTDRSWRMNTPACSAQGGTALSYALIQAQAVPSGTCASSCPKHIPADYHTCVGFFPSLSPRPSLYAAFLSSPPTEATCTGVLSSSALKEPNPRPMHKNDHNCSHLFSSVYVPGGMVLSYFHGLSHLMTTAVLMESLIITLLLLRGDPGPERPSNLPKVIQPGSVRISLLEAKVSTWTPPADPFSPTSSIL